MTFIGNEILRLRKNNKMTQRQLAMKASVDYSTLKKVETGKTKNPSPEFIEKVANALEVSLSSLIDAPKPDVGGGNILPFKELTPGNFVSLVDMILRSKKEEYTDIQVFDGVGDKKRDIIAKKILNGKNSQFYTLFQVKRYARTDSSTLKRELEGIKKYFFSNKNTPTPIESIVFCLADSPSAYIKDEVIKHAIFLELPSPIFWDGRALDNMCKMQEASRDIKNKFFGGHFGEIEENQKELKQITKELDKDFKSVKEIIENDSRTIASIDGKLFAANALETDAKMAHVRRLINEEKYSEAKEILLELKIEVEKPGEEVRRKKWYNNLGVCFSHDEKKEDIDRGIEYLEKAIDLDPDFDIPKRNLIENVIRKKISNKYQLALKFSEELLAKDKKNLDYISLHIYVLNICNKLSESKNFIESYDNPRDEFGRNENMTAVVSETYLRLKEFELASSYIDMGLCNFPESINLNRLKGHTLMEEVEKGGYELKSSDLIPLFFKSNLATKATEYFSKALDYAKINNWPEDTLNEIKFDLYNAAVISGRVEKPIIKEDKLSDVQKQTKLFGDASDKLTKNRDYTGAYDLFQKIIKDCNYSYEEIKDVARKFLYNGSPECAIRFLLPLMTEAKDKMDFECWALLSISYVLEGKKNEALSKMNEAKAIFSSDKEIYRDVLSHYSALMGRYQDNSESDRFVQNIFELQNITPEKTIIKPVQLIESDGSVSNEIRDFFIRARQSFEKKRELFLTNPMPVYFLQKMFERSFPEAIEIPKNNYDFSFVIPYNTLDKEFKEYQEENFKNSSFVIDYCALLNFARCGQLGLLSALGKKIKASEELLFDVQKDLALCEKQILRDAWDFLRKGEVEIFPRHKKSEDQKSPSESIKKSFSDHKWLIESMIYCMNNDAVFLTDDWRLIGLMKSEDIGVKSVNSFIFFQAGLEKSLLDRKQYSLALGELAGLFFHFIPFNGEDFLNIVLDDNNRIKNHTIPFGKNLKQNPSLEISLRAYHLLNQINLPGSDLKSFLSVCFNFLVRLLRLAVLEEEKIDWTLFLVNFFNEIGKDDAKYEYLEFAIQSWLALNKFTTDKCRNLMLTKVEEIQNEFVRIAIKNELNKK